MMEIISFSLHFTLKQKRLLSNEFSFLFSGLWLFSGHDSMICFIFPEMLCFYPLRQIKAQSPGSVEYADSVSIERMGSDLFIYRLFIIIMSCRRHGYP